MKTFHLVNKKRTWVLETEKPDGSGLGFPLKTTKAVALKASVEFCKEWYKDHGTPVSLRIHKRNGEIQGERTYPLSADPRSSKG